MRNFHPHFGVTATIVTAVLLVLLVGGSLWRSRDRVARLRARRARDPRALTRSYLRSLATWWPVAMVVAAVAASDEGLGLAGLGLTVPAGADSPTTWLLAAGIAMLTGIGLARRRRLWANLDALPVPMRRVAAILPVTGAERRLAAGIAVTAGVCEEVVFRGLFIAAGVGILGLPVLGSLVLSAVAFGLCHTYQGPVRALGTAVGGLLLGLLYVVSGGLLLPITLHTAVDLLALVPVPGALVARELGIAPAGQAPAGTAPVPGEA